MSRLYISSKKGIMDLFINTIVPLFPILLLIFNISSDKRVYLYVLNITVLIGFIFEFFSYEKPTNKFLLIEILVTLFALLCLSGYTIFSLIKVSEYPEQISFTTLDYVFNGLFIIPILVKLIEIFIVICVEFNAIEYNQNQCDSNSHNTITNNKVNKNKNSKKRKNTNKCCNSLKGGAGI